MNKRIKELIEKATTVELGVDNGFDRVTFDKEKFAELLAKELANHIAGQLPNERLDDWHEGYHAGVQRSIDCLKEFGVQ